MSDTKTSATAAGTVPQCPHLPPFDHASPQWRDNERELIEAYRKECPFGRSSAHGGFVYAMEPNTVRELFNQPETFVSSRGLAVPDAPVPNTMIPINIDPPDLYDWRQLLAPHFSPALMQEELPRLRREALELFDAAAAEGPTVDMVNQVAQPLTGRTTLRVMGLDPEDWTEYAVAFHGFAFGLTQFDEAAVQMREMEDKLRSDIRERIGTPNATGLIRHLSEDASFHGRPLEFEEIWNICLILMGGGLDTTQALVGSATKFLGENPDRQQELIDHPERMAGAIEEFLRVWPPTQNLKREAVKDAEVEGFTIPADTPVVLSLVGANFDPTEFPDPYELDFCREPNRHFSFGMGPHRCLGSHLARVEITACLEALLNRAPGFSVKPADEHLARHIGTFYGYERVEVILP